MRVCSYCGLPYGVSGDPQDERQTHGICPPCYREKTGKAHPDEPKEAA